MAQNQIKTIHEFEEKAKKKERAMREASLRPLVRFRGWEKPSILSQKATIWTSPTVQIKEPEGSKLPFDPGEFDRNNVDELLPSIGSYGEHVRTEIYRHTKDFYLNEADEILPRDILSIRQTQLYAEDADFSEWVSELESIVESAFTEYQDSPVVSSRTRNSLEDLITPHEARALLEERRMRLQEAMGENFGEEKEEVLKEMQMSFIKLILPDVQER